MAQPAGWQDPGMHRGEPPTLSGSYFLSSSAKSLSYEPETAMMRGKMLSLFFST